MSDPAEDVVNDSKKGTSDHDPLFRLKPLMTEIKAACKSFYQPNKNLVIDERMVATKAKTGMTQYIKDKPTKWGFKLFILADSSNGYTSSFTMYTGKAKFPTGFGLSYDAVVGVLDKPYLGSGYHIYCDNFYTSPQLFRHLSSLHFRACGTYREGRKETPKSTVNALSKKSQRGTIRWIRDGDFLFVKWMDTREVSICSTIHQAYTSEKVARRQKKRDGTWEKVSIPVPTPVVENNKYMRGVDLSDQLIQYTSAHHKAHRWYKTMFLHFVDIATCNSYILHKELCEEQKSTPLTHRAFTEELCAQLAGVTSKVQTTVAADRTTHHTPLPIAPLDPANPAHKPADTRNYELPGGKIYFFPRGIIDYALLLSGSTFTVGYTDEEHRKPTVSSQPGSVHVMPAKPEPLHVMPANPEQSKDVLQMILDSEEECFLRGTQTTNGSILKSEFRRGHNFGVSFT
ncbi:hypothetical protein PO909_023437 [Leuciscus waleckii]